MARDLIVDEVRAIRAAIAKEHGYNLRKTVQTLQTRAEGTRQASRIIGAEAPDRIPAA